MSPLLTTFAADGISAFGFSRGVASAGAYELITTTILSSATNTIEFASISSTYKHLQIRAIAHKSVDDIFNVYLNAGDKTSSTHRLYGDGGGTASSAWTSQSGFFYGPQMTNLSNVWSPMIMDFLDYGSTTKNKTVRSFAGYAGSSSKVQLFSGMSQETAAISTITFIAPSGNFDIGSRFSLYGIKG